MKEEQINPKDKTIVDSAELEQLSINTIRFLSVDAVEKANSGHPGLPLGAAPMAYVLWTKFLKHNPANPDWINRDRFVLSAGHGSMLLYSLLYLTGYKLPLEQIEQFRQWKSITPGHPERKLTPGVETTTGPLGQGFANGVGMAIAEAYLSERYNQCGFNMIDHYTYGLVSDGDLMEGVASEAASLAGHLKLRKLIYLYDCNHITLAASTRLTFTEDVAKRFESYCWNVITVEDGNNTLDIENAIRKAQFDSTRPSLIIVNTHIGFGSPNKQDTFAAHGSPLGKEEVRLTKENLGWPAEPLFFIPENVLSHFRQAADWGIEVEDLWQQSFEDYQTLFPELAKELNQLLKGQPIPGWDENIPHFAADVKGIATRVASGKILEYASQFFPGLIGGSADLNPSTMTEIKNGGNFENPETAIGDLQGESSGGWNYNGRNIHFGVREHGMGAILNGIAAHGGLIPFGSTFLTFSDYMRPSIRLAALMGLQVIYVFTHDSIAMGEDGPTHQPVEHLASLRAIPNLIVIRPCDANETAVSWQVALETNDHPTALVLTRQNVPIIDRDKFAKADNLRKGAYILADAANADPELILIASGSEVHLVVEAYRILTEKNIRVRIVSMPCWELFEMQTAEYRDAVLPPSVKKRLSIEAGVAQGWHKYVGEKGAIISLDHFGASAPGAVLMKEFGFTVENLCSIALAMPE